MHALDQCIVYSFTSSRCGSNISNDVRASTIGERGTGFDAFLFVSSCWWGLVGTTTASDGVDNDGVICVSAFGSDRQNSRKSCFDPYQSTTKKTLPAGVNDDVDQCIETKSLPAPGKLVVIVSIMAHYN
mmetsp:Transcript_17172/g.37564  ORF Transcript_17172/g.37564 Transcript_17172/m.37564 type:complete len:129 (+) Transcript_17172:270-656(+)